MKKGRHRRFQEARALKRQDLDSDSLSEIESLLDEEEDIYEAGVVEDAGISYAPARERTDNGGSDEVGFDDGGRDAGRPADDGGSDEGSAEGEDGDGDDWRKEVEQYLNDSND